MIIENNLLDSEIIKSFIKKYEFPEELKIKLIITDDMEKVYNNLLKEYNKPYDYVSVIDYNGVTFVPNTIHEETVLIINYDRVEQAITSTNLEIICTIFHELIHAKDYYNYFKNYCDGIYDSSINRDAQYGFINWSEFNAKRISYLEYCKLIHGDKLKSNEELNNIKKYELPNKNTSIENKLEDDNLDFEDVIYELMFYLGRYSVWEDLFDKEFKQGKLFSKDLLKIEPLITDLYNCLKNNKGQLENYIEIKKLLNYFKGSLVNIQTTNHNKNESLLNSNKNEINALLNVLSKEDLSILKENKIDIYSLKLVDIIEKVEDLIQLKGFENDEVNKFGKKCEKLLDKLTDMDEMYTYVSVVYLDEELNKIENQTTIYYKTNLETVIKVGDKVLVNRLNQNMVAQVESIDYYNKYDAPYPITKTKDILKVYNGDILFIYDYETNSKIPKEVIGKYQYIGGLDDIELTKNNIYCRVEPDDEFWIVNDSEIDYLYDDKYFMEIK